MNITFVKGSHCYNHVRVLKFVDYLKQRNIDHQFICWLREERFRSSTHGEKYIFQGGGFGGKTLVFFYPLWMKNLFLHVMKQRYPKGHVFFAIDLDAALPIYIASLFRKDIKYIYDIHDDFAKRYRTPNILKKVISLIDYKVRSAALKTIHVDDNRVSSSDRNFIIIYNSPKDFFNSTYRSPQLPTTKTFCVSGLLSETRGVRSLYEFAKKNNSIKFIVAGHPIDRISKEFIALENVTYLGTVEQITLFNNIKDCHGIFSLYDPSIEINRLAASNKLYDAMMLGIPVIVNKGIVAESLVKKEQIGFVINYHYDSTWNSLLSTDDMVYTNYGKNGRNLYEKNYSYSKNIENKFGELLENINDV